MKPDRIYLQKTFDTTQWHVDTSYTSQDNDARSTQFPDITYHPAGNMFEQTISVDATNTVTRKIPFFTDENKNHGLMLLAASVGTPGVRYRLVNTVVTQRVTGDTSEHEFDGQDADNWSDYQELRPAAFLTVAPPGTEIQFIGHSATMDVMLVGWETLDDMADWGLMNP